MASHRIFPHGEFQELAPGVWRVRGGLPFPFTRNMIVVRLPGGLLLHSVVALDEAGMTTLESLGRPTWSIVPSAAHRMDAPFYQARYPDLKTLTVAAVRTAVETTVKVDATVEETLPALGIKLHAVPATRAIEYVYELAMPGGGRMLMANDVLGNINAAAPGFLGDTLFSQIWVPSGAPNIGRLYRWLQAKDLGAIRRFLAGLADVPDLRLVTVSHGDPITSDPAAKLRALAPA